jgi:hypothetical protein
MDTNSLISPNNFHSQDSIIDFLSGWGYQVEFTPWDISDMPDRTRERIGAMTLISHYGDSTAPFQIFLVEMDIPRQVKRVRRTDLRIILEPFYRRYPQGEYLFIFALPGYSSVAFVSPKRIRPSATSAAAAKLQLRILTLDPQHLYHTDRWVLEQIRLKPEDQTADAIWQKQLAAFDVERVTRRFYKGYKDVLATLEAELVTQCQIDATPTQVHAFAQQLLNRLMFLYFVQKKGWLRWNGEPDPHYLLTMWVRYREGERICDSGYYEWLRSLFLDAFNNRRSAVAANPTLPKDIRDSFLGMPYLNGGLFERNELDDLGLSVPDELFAQLFDQFQDEEPGFLERYNFTVDESTPLDVEVAVDPEMLGKVYESLVAEEERHTAGIFYTPREEIDYMCRLSLTEYLHQQTGYPKDDLIPLAMEPSRLLETPEDDIIPFGNLSKTKQHQALRAIEKALHQLRVVDPAVGSGSFLVGMMKVLVEIQQAIAQRLERKRFNEFDLKRRIIMENLYGVDVKDWAVRACELRLWLSLTIEAEEQDIGLYTNPVLPKLSFRVRQGDSLVEEVAGVPLVLRGDYAYVSPQLEHRINKLAEMKLEYFGGRSLLKQGQIEREESKLLQGVLNSAIDRLNRQLDALRRPLERQASFEGMDVTTPRQLRLNEERRKQQVDTLSQKREGLIKVRKNLVKRKVPPFFIWDVGFGEVFAEKGGFDIVIGNPPYVRNEEIAPPVLPPEQVTREVKRTYKAQLYRGAQALWGQGLTFDRAADLYVYFYFAGLSLLQPGGIFCFVNSNSWLDVEYGVGLQRFLLERMKPLMVVDNQARRTFEADINTIIVLIERPQNGEHLGDHRVRFVTFRKPFEHTLTVHNLLAIEQSEATTSTDDFRVFPVPQQRLLEEGLIREEGSFTATYVGSKWGGKYLRAPDIFFRILKLASDRLVKLGDIAHVDSGINTRANDFFYLEQVSRDQWEAVSFENHSGLVPEGCTVVRSNVGVSKSRGCTPQLEPTYWVIEERFLRPVIVSPQKSPCIEIDPARLKHLVLSVYDDWNDLAGTYVRDYIEYAMQSLQVQRRDGRWVEALAVNRRPELSKRRQIDDRGRRAGWWYTVRDKQYGTVLVPEATHEALRVLYTPHIIPIDHRLFSIVSTTLDQKSLKGLALFFNGVFGNLIHELFSRVNLGQGAITTDAVDWKKMICPEPILLAKIAEQYGYTPALFRRRIGPIWDEVNEPDKVRLDEIVLEVLGVPISWREELAEATVALVKARIEKARSLRR